MDRSSKNRLTDKLLGQFPGEALFDRVARAVCRAGCLPRKQLYEAWEVARRVRRRFRGGRVIDLAEAWPRLKGRVLLQQADLETIQLERNDLVVSVHACGNLTDLVLERAMAARAKVAVLPCCHELKQGDLGGLQGWLDGPLAMDVMRAERLRSAGYRVMTQQIPGDITPKNRLLLAEPEIMI